MKIILSFCLFLISIQGIYSQESTQFLTTKSSVKLPFELVNNLIILPIKVNGIELNFLVDTGVEETILFSVDQNKEIPIFNVEKITLKGLGVQEAVEGFKSFKNTLSVKDLNFLNQEIVIVLDQNYNFSAALGIEVNGIIGYHFFSQIISKIDYKRKKMIIYKRDTFNKNKITKNFQLFDFRLENGKPYITIQVASANQLLEANCLVDSGNSDGLWLFATKINSISVPELNFEDYLGRGFNGEIYGKKAKVKKLVLNKFEFNEVFAAFPDSLSLANVKIGTRRLGSIGSEILKRFTVILDYQSKQMYLRKNSFFEEKFRYNLSGITIHHVGMQWFKEEMPIKEFSLNHKTQYKLSLAADLKYNFKLLPVYEIVTIRNNSPAAKAGLQVGDVILKINSIKVQRLSLDKINELLKRTNQEEVTIVVERDGKELTYQFKIVDLL
jgi:hypothetical protein